MMGDSIPLVRLGPTSFICCYGDALPLPPSCFPHVTKHNHVTPVLGFPPFT